MGRLETKFCFTESVFKSLYCLPASLRQSRTCNARRFKVLVWWEVGGCEVRKLQD
jgi:hypothetical protein